MLNKLDQNGNATIEMIPVLMLFILMVNFSLGFFGIIHSGILNSIAARNYAFETFRNRANLNYLRDEAVTPGSSIMPPFYSTTGFRLHAITAETAPINTWVATTRPLRFTDLKGVPNGTGASAVHNQGVRNSAIDSATKTSDVSSLNSGVSPVWLMQSYGICLNANCGK